MNQIMNIPEFTSLNNFHLHSIGIRERKRQGELLRNLQVKFRMRPEAGSGQEAVTADSNTGLRFKLVDSRDNKGRHEMQWHVRRNIEKKLKELNSPLSPTQGSNPCPLQWKHGVLTSRSPGKPLKALEKRKFLYISERHFGSCVRKLKTFLVLMQFLKILC